MQVYECEEWQHEMSYIKVFEMSTRLHLTYISTPLYLIKHHTKLSKVKQTILCTNTDSGEQHHSHLF